MPLINQAARWEGSNPDEAGTPGTTLMWAHDIASQPGSSSTGNRKRTRQEEEESSSNTYHIHLSPPPCQSKKREGNASAGLSRSSDRSQSRNLEQAAGVSAGRRAAGACARA